MIIAARIIADHAVPKAADADPSCLFSGAFDTWFPALRARYREVQHAVLKAYPSLNLPSKHSSFAALSVNMGPQTICLPHRDKGNLSYGICTDFVLGDFDHTRGGHLVLHESRHIAELRPGAILLFPSSCITHENIPIQASETRFSMTTYSSGGLRRFCDQGLQVRRQWEARDPEAVRVHDEAGAARWAEGCALLEDLEALVSRWSLN